MRPPRWRIVTPPAPLLTLTRVKEQCRVDSTTEDAYLSHLLAAATEYVEAILGQSLVTRTVEAYFAAWPQVADMPLPRPPVAAVAYVRYVKADGTTADMSASGYRVHASGITALDGWPRDELAKGGEPITVRYTAGGNAADVPAAIQHAVLLLVSHWYEHREAAAHGHVSREIELGVHALLAQHRLW